MVLCTPESFGERRRRNVEFGGDLVKRCRSWNFEIAHFVSELNRLALGSVRPLSGSPATPSGVSRRSERYSIEVYAHSECVLYWHVKSDSDIAVPLIAIPFPTHYTGVFAMTFRQQELIRQSNSNSCE